MGQMMDKSAQMVGLKPNAMEKMSTFFGHFGGQNDLVAKFLVSISHSIKARMVQLGQGMTWRGSSSITDDI